MTGEWKGRPATIRRAVHVTYLDGAQPFTEVLVLDDDAPPGGRTEWFYRGEAPDDDPTSAPEAPDALDPSDPPPSPPQRSTGAHSGRTGGA